MRIRIGPRLMGHELYGAEDPAEFAQYCGQEVTVRKIDKPDQWMVYIEEHDRACFFMEEVECILDDAEIDESGESLNTLLGVMV